MKHLLHVYKPQGFTPLDIIKQLREKFPEYENEKIGFAGRLDPLAHGVLLLMIGEETTKQKDRYLHLTKEYEFEVVFGVATDTYDTLGMLMNKPTYSSSERSESRSSNETMQQFNKSARQARTLNLKKAIQTFIKSKIGKQLQKYPPFSSKAIGGKPLFWWAKNNKLHEIKIPQREIEIFDFQLINTNTISSDKLKKEIFRQINLVQGDFRQEEIKKGWNNFFSHPEFISGSAKQKMLKRVQHGKMKSFKTAKFSIICSSGTYVRSLANELGEQLGTGAITLDILRTKVGIYNFTSAMKLTS